MNENNRISIVVLAYNQFNEVVRTVHALHDIAPDAAIVVVDNGSTDGTTQKIGAACPEVEVVRSSVNLGAAARTLGVERVRTRYVAFADTDTLWEPGAIERAADLLDSNPNIAVIAARVLVGERRRLDPVCYAMEESPLPSASLPGNAVLGFMSGACLMRTMLYRTVGGYEPRLHRGGEEALMALDFAALGFHAVYCRDVVARHLPSSSRDTKTRRWLFARNAIWTACLRLPWKHALPAVGRMLVQMQRDGVLVVGFLKTLIGLPWCLSHRRVVPVPVQRMWELLQAKPREYPVLAANTEGHAGVTTASRLMQ